MKKLLILLMLLFSLNETKAQSSSPMESVYLETCFIHDASTGKIMLRATHSYYATFYAYYDNPFTTWAYVKSGPTTYGPFIVTTVIPGGPTAPVTYYEVTIPGFSAQACYEVWFTSNAVWYYDDPTNLWGYTPAPTLHPSLPPASKVFTAPNGRRYNIITTDVHEACICAESDPMAPCNAHFRLNLTVNTRPAAPPAGGVGTAYINGGSIELHEFNPLSTYIYEWDGIAGPSSAPVFFPTPFMTPGLAPGTHTVCVTEMNPSGSTCKTCMTFCVPAYATETGPVITEKTTAANANAQPDNTIELYPNPANNKTELKFVLDKDQVVAVHVLDMTGKTIIEIPASQMNAGTQKLELNTQTLASGIYQVQIHKASGTVTKKLSVTK